ncbi:hypothetical protein KJ365_05445 [Glaciecola sp. XM2]|uniref:hypothetical protein n=1 Tax=Glaciecola sp. XM2 TaxID=1914931 RepID=UPI001BDF082C|nr:hypothetical protein [Glaciecola sp. XM2]MBT1450318.1 hypothetical protein [Glaciecola sp. XM2]
MNNVVSALNENLQIAYRKAIDADQALNTLQSDGKGKFQTIFGDETVFTSRSKRFKEYVEEVAGDVALLQQQDATLSKQAQQEKLTVIVKKLQLLLTTLEQFKLSLAGKS